MAANMDTTGTFEIAKAFHEHNLFVCMHKHYSYGRISLFICDLTRHFSVEQWVQFAKNNPEVIKNVAVSSGTSDNDFEKMSAILKAVPEVAFICIDVANG